MRGIEIEELVDCMQAIAPLEYAEEWDNAGLLIEPIAERRIERMLLTIDLTEAVADEAIDIGAEAVIAYHPVLFTPASSLRRAIPADWVVIKMIKHDIAVYSPHTALDAVSGGVNDWLAGLLGEGKTSAIELVNDHDVHTGMGRILELTKPVELSHLIEKCRSGMGIDHLKVAKSPGGAHEIKTIALCAGAGASVLAGVEADLYLTGEMKHHDVLSAIQNGVHVVLCGHTNTERGYLALLADRIESQLGSGLEVMISSQDRDPFSESVPSRSLFQHSVFEIHHS